jgi:hypothetical protein
MIHFVNVNARTGQINENVFELKYFITGVENEKFYDNPNKYIALRSDILNATNSDVLTDVDRNITVTKIVATNGRIQYALGGNASVQFGKQEGSYDAVGFTSTSNGMAFYVQKMETSQDGNKVAAWTIVSDYRNAVVINAVTKEEIRKIEYGRWESLTAGERVFYVVGTVVVVAVAIVATIVTCGGAAAVGGAFGIGAGATASFSGAMGVITATALYSAAGFGLAAGGAYWFNHGANALTSTFLVNAGISLSIASIASLGAAVAGWGAGFGALPLTEAIGTKILMPLGMPGLYATGANLALTLSGNHDKDLPFLNTLQGAMNVVSWLSYAGLAGGLMSMASKALTAAAAKEISAKTISAAVTGAIKTSPVFVKLFVGGALAYGIGSGFQAYGIRTAWTSALIQIGSVAMVCGLFGIASANAGFAALTGGSFFKEAMTFLTLTGLSAILAAPALENGAALRRFGFAAILLGVGARAAAAWGGSLVQASGSNLLVAVNNWGLLGLGSTLVVGLTIQLALPNFESIRGINIFVAKIFAGFLAAKAAMLFFGNPFMSFEANMSVVETEHGGIPPGMGWCRSRIVGCFDTYRWAETSRSWNDPDRACTAGHCRLENHGDEGGRCHCGCQPGRNGPRSYDRRAAIRDGCLVRKRRYQSILGIRGRKRPVFQVLPGHDGGFRH